VLRGKPHELAQVGFALAVDRSERLPHEGAEDMGLAVLEVLVVLCDTARMPRRGSSTPRSTR